MLFLDEIKIKSREAERRKASEPQRDSAPGTTRRVMTVTPPPLKPCQSTTIEHTLLFKAAPDILKK